MCEMYLYAEVSSVNIIAEEQIPSLCRITSNLEEFHQIKVLSMHITTDCDWRIHLEKIRFAFENLCTSLNDPECLFFRQSSFPIEMLLEVCQIGLGSVLRREELVFGWRVECGCLYL